MAPQTRSRIAVNDAPEVDQDRNLSEEPSDASGIEVHLSKALKDARNLHKEIASLRRRNAGLEKTLESIEQAEDASVQPKRGKKGGPTVAKLQVEVRRLNERVRMLQKEKQRDRKKIEKLRIREAQADATELQDDAEFEVGDSAYRMRKLLRHFHDIMVSSSIEENEECPICLEKLTIKQCSSLACEHTICNECLSRISTASEVVTCPQCRAPCPRDEVEVLQYTASEQWDALLEVAKAWAKMDRRREADTSEEEAEEEFIDDGQPEDEESTTADTNPIATSPEPDPEPELKPEEAVVEDGLEGADSPATPNKKRRIAYSPESSPLSGENDPVPVQAPPPEIPARTTEGESSSVLSSAPEGIAGPSRLATPPPSTPPNDASVSEATSPSYAQSPVSEKRKKLAALAEARKRKRRI